MRTQRAAVAAHDHDQFQQLLAGAKAQFAKANALTDRLNLELADLEAAWDAASEELTGSDDEQSDEDEQLAAQEKTVATAGEIESPADLLADDEDLDPAADDDDDELEECTPPGDCYTCDDTARATCDACPDYLRPPLSNSHAALRRALERRTPEGEAPRTPLGG